MNKKGTASENWSFSERNGLTISCPLPGWTYSLETGEATRGGGKLQLYVTEVDDGAVWIRLPGTRHDQQT